MLASQNLRAFSLKGKVSNYLMPFIILFKNGEMANKIKAATKVSAAINQNKGRSNLVTSAFICDATKLPAANEPIQTPIMVEVIFTGESLVTIDKPMGDKQSSPNVWNK